MKKSSFEMFDKGLIKEIMRVVYFLNFDVEGGRTKFCFEIKQIAKHISILKSFSFIFGL